MLTLKMYNEKGNVSVKVRDSIRSQVKNKLSQALENEFGEIIANVNGGISIPLAIDELSGETIYANVDFTVNKADPNEKKVRKSSNKKDGKVKEDVPSIF